jgi:spore maturation protein CgeB
MNKNPLRIVVLGLSLSSSWGNGHATTYRALLKALAERGHDILFLERDVPWYAEHRDLTDPSYCRLAFYTGLGALDRDYRAEITQADVIILGSFVLDGIEVGEWILANARGVTAFYDIDTPVTLAAIEAGTCAYLSAEQIARYDLYLSFTSGPVLHRLASRFGARRPRVLYCSVDAQLYRPQPSVRRWDLGYLGTYSDDRQPMLELLLLEPARRAPHLRFVVAGAQYPSSIAWPANVEHIPHLAPADHPRFYSSLNWALNVTRSDMVKAGHSPSVRLFEAAACRAPIISDSWPGLEQLFTANREIVIATSADEVLQALSMPEKQRKRMAAAGQARILAQHTSPHRAAQLEGYVLPLLRHEHADAAATLQLTP